MTSMKVKRETGENVLMFNIIEAKTLVEEFVHYIWNPVFSEIEDDIFTSKDSLVHCASAYLKMSAGIAKEFRNWFARVEEHKRQHKNSEK